MILWGLKHLIGMHACIPQRERRLNPLMLQRKCCGVFGIGEKAVRSAQEISRFGNLIRCQKLAHNSRIAVG